MNLISEAGTNPHYFNYLKIGNLINRVVIDLMEPFDKLVKEIML